MNIKMRKDKETPNAIRYSDGAESHAKNIYLTKEELKAGFGEIPETLNVEITKG